MEYYWRLQLLGDLRATWLGPPRGSHPLVVARFPSRKTGLLLAYLALHPRAHSREALIDHFWPEADPAAGRQSLSRALSSLRNLLEPPGVPQNGVLVADRGSVGLRSGAVTSDVAEFEAALQRASEVDGRLERAETLRHAVDLYPDELLPECLEDWVLDRRGSLAERYFDAVARLVGALEALGDPEQAIETARRGIAADPLREESHRLLIRLLVVAGRPAAARSQYEELARLLERELGAEPTESTRSSGRVI